MADVEVRGVTLAYGALTVLEDVSFVVGPGERLAIVGPNGAGKSTLLKALAGVVTPTKGSIEIAGRRPGADGTAVAYLSQRTAFDPDYPAQVWEVVAMGRYPHVGGIRRLTRRDRERVEQALAEVGLEDLARRRISALSGGQQQRMFLARALAQEVGVLLLDEPYAGIDFAAEQIIEDRLTRFVVDGGTVILVNHDLVSLSAREQRLLLLRGRVVADGPPAEVLARGPLAEAYGGVPALLDQREA